MLNRLSEKLGDIAHRLSGAARVSEADLDRTLREMRMALLEADVALPVVRHLIGEARSGRWAPMSPGACSPAR